MSDNIKVAIKVRPLITREQEENLTEQWLIQENSLMPNTGSANEVFYFDHVFDTRASNLDVYNAVVAPITAAAVNGFNGTIFAYGQTSSGKTYTMTGSKQECGIVQLVINDIFQLIARHSNREFLLRASFIEIYNEKIHDLLDSSKNKATINVYEEDGVVKLNVKEEISDTPDNLMDIMRRGEKNRVIGETNMNERSSRSHTIFRIIIESRNSNTNDPDGAIQVAHLNLVDLAGSERVSQTGAKGARLREGTHINLSLLTLSRVINQLSKMNTSEFISFRDSKLTRILQSSLGGNAKTVIICAITPASLEESMSTLSFASRAKSIKNKPKVNEIVSNDTLLKRYAKQISILQDQLEREKNANMNIQSNQEEELLLVNRRLQERICLLQKFMLRPQTTPVKPILPTHAGTLGHIESIEKTLRRQTWCAPAKNLFSLPMQQQQSVFTEDMHVDILRNKLNDITLNHSSSFISGEKFEFEKIFDFNNSILLKENIQNDNESIPMETFELELIESVKHKVNETLTSPISSSPSTTTSTSTIVASPGVSSDEESDLEKLKAQLNYFKMEYETLKEFVEDERIILNEHNIELEKRNEEIILENSKLNDLLNTKDGEIKLLNIKLSRYSSNNPLLGNDTIDVAITRLLQKKDEILEIKNDISKQITSYNVQDVDKNTDYLKRLHNEFTEILKIFEMNSKVAISMQRLNHRYQTTIQNLKLPRNKLGTIVENVDNEESFNLIEDIVTDTLRLQTMIREMNNEIEYLQEHNRTMEKEHEKLREELFIKIKDQVNDNKKLQFTVDNLTTEKLDLEQKYAKTIEFKKQIEQEKEFWEELQRKNKNLKQQIDTLQETKNDFDIKLKNLEETYSIKITDTTNELQLKLNTLEMYNKTLESDVKALKENNQSLEFNYKDIQNNYNQIQQLHSEFYHELQKLKNRFEKLFLKTLSSAVVTVDDNINDGSKENQLVLQYRNLIDSVDKYLQNEDVIKYELENKIRDLTSQIVQFQLETDQKSNLESTTYDKHHFEETIKTLQAELNMAHSTVQDLETRILNQKQDIDNQIQRLNEKDKKCMEGDREINSIKEELKMKDLKITELEKQIENMKLNSTEQNDRLIRYQEDMKKLEELELKDNDLAAKSALIKELEDNINSVKEELKLKNLNIFELEKQIEDMKLNSAEQNYRLISYQEEMKKLEELELKEKDLMEKSVLIKELEDNINSVKGELKLKNLNISELEKQIEDLKLNSAEQNDRLISYQEEMKKLEELELKEKDLMEKSVLIKELEDNINSVKGELKLKNLNISELEKQIEDLKLNSAEQNDRLISYQEEMKKLEELELKEKDLMEKSVLIKELEDNINSVKGELKLKNLNISELEKQIEDLKLNSAEQNDRLISYQEEMKKLEQLNLKDKDLTEKSLLIKQLESNVNSVHGELKLKNLKISELEKQTKILDQNLTEKLSLINEMECSIKSLKEELEVKDLKISELEKQIKDIQNINLTQNRDIMIYQEEIQTMKNTHEELKDKNVTDKSILVKEFEDSTHSLKEELNLKNLRITELEKETMDFKQNRDEIHNMMTKLEESELESKNLKEHEISTNSLTEELKLKNLKILELEEKFEEIKRSNLEQNGVVMNYQDEIKNMTKQLEQSELQELTRKSLEEVDVSINTLKEELKMKNFKITELEEEIEEIKHFNLEQNRDIVNYQQEIKNMMEKLEIQDKNLTRKSSLMVEFENSIKTLKEELKMKNVKISELEEEIEEIKHFNLEQNRDIVNYQQEISSMMKRMDETELKDTDLMEKSACTIKEDNINSVQEELKLKNLKISELEKQIEDMKLNSAEQNDRLIGYQEEMKKLDKLKLKEKRNEELNMAQSTVENLETRIFNQKQDIDNQIQRLNEKDKKCMEDDREINSIKDELKMKDLKITELEKQIEDMKLNSTEQNNRLISYQEEMKKLEELELKDNDLAAKSALIKELEDNINSVKEELKLKNLNIFELEKQIEDMKLNSAEQNDRLISYQEEMKKLEELELKEKDLMEKSVLIKELDDNINSVNGELKLKNLKISELEKEMVDIKLNIAEQNDRLISYQDKMKKLEELELKDKDLIEKSTIMKELENNIHSVKGELKLKNFKISELEKQIEDLNLNSTKQNDRLISYQEEMISTMKKLEELEFKDKHLNEKSVLIKQLEENMISVKEELKFKSLKLSELEKQMEDTNLISVEQNDHLNGYQEEMSSSKKKLKELELKDNDLAEKMILINEFERSTSSLKDELKVKDLIISELEKQIKDIQNINLTQNRDILLYQEEIQALKKSRDELKLKCTNLTDKPILVKEFERNESFDLHSLSEFKNTIENIQPNQVLVNCQDKTEEEMKYLKNTIEELKRKYNHLHENNLKLDTEKTILEDKISNIVSEQNKLTIEHETQINNLTHQIEQLKLVNGNKDLSDKNPTDIEKKFKDSEETYKSKIQKLMKEKEKLVNMHKISVQNFKQARCENFKIQAQLTTLESRYKDKETAMEQLELKIKQLEKEPRDDKLVNSLKETLTIRETTIQNLKERMVRLERKLKEKQQLIESLHQELELKRMTLSDLERRNDEQTENLNSKDTIIQNLKENTETLERQLKNIKIDFEDKVKSLKQEFETKNMSNLETATNNIENLQKLNHELKENISSQDTLTRSLKESIETVEQEKTNIKIDLEDKIKSLESKNLIISNLEAKIFKLENLLKKNQEQNDNNVQQQNNFEDNIRSLKEELESKNLIISNLKATIFKLENLLKKNMEQNDNNVQQQNNFEDNIRSLKEELESKNLIISNLEATIFKLENLLKKNQEQNDNNVQQQNNFEDNIRSFKQELESKNLIISNLEAKIFKLDNLLKKNQEQNDNNVQQQNNFEDNIRSLKQELESKNNTILNLEAAILKLENLEKLNQEQINDLRTELDKINIKYTDLMNTSKSSIDLKSKDNTTLETTNLETMDKMKKRIRELQRKLLLSEKENEKVTKRLEKMVQRNDEYSETYSQQLFTETEYLETMINNLKKELEQKNNQIKIFETDKNIIQNLKIQLEKSDNECKELKTSHQLKDQTIQNLNKNLGIQENMISDLNNKLLPLKNHNGPSAAGPLKENYNKHESSSDYDKYKIEIQKLTKEKERFMQISQMNSKQLKQVRCEKLKIEAQLTCLESKYKDKETSEAQLQLMLQEIQIANATLIEKNNELMEKIQQNRCENCCSQTTSHLNKQLELEVMSIKNENEMNIQKIHELEDKIIELRFPDHHHRSNTPSPNTVRKNRLSISKRNELFDESRRIRMENELIAAQQQHLAISNVVPVSKHDQEIQVNIIGPSDYHGSGIVSQYQWDKALHDMTKKKNYYKELAILRKRNLEEVQNKPCEKCKTKNMVNDENI